MLYIMRHGKTEWNELHKLQGRTDIPLNEEGRQMAKIAGEKYKDINFDVCYCSPLVRAKETAKLVLEGRNIPIIYDDRLKEMSFGIYEGMEIRRKRQIVLFVHFLKNLKNTKELRKAKHFMSCLNEQENSLKKLLCLI